MVIGSHPHIVQESETLRLRSGQEGKIYYSLGNFIFDQYFSKDTQEGLMVGLSKENTKFIYYIVPLKGVRSAVNFFDNNESKLFLIDLAKRSSVDLTNMIESGKIELIR